MDWKYQKMLKFFKNTDNNNKLILFKGGLEREGLRINKKGMLSKKDHPLLLGRSLMHQYITTDFAESQLELRSKPYSDIENLYNNFYWLHAYTYKKIGNELIWQNSLPPKLPKDLSKIKIAKFGKSNLGQFKEIYRIGLSHRYGRKMQTLSGIHFNFSFNPKLLDLLHENFGIRISKKEFRSELYLHVARNISRLSPLLILLFGSSPKEQNTDKNHVSVRMSNHGYINSSRCKAKISNNSFDNFIRDFKKYLGTSCPIYEKIGLKKKGKYIQLNTNILQIEAEYYNIVRMKPQKSSLRPISSFEKQGIGYLEYRGLDIDSNSPLGISKTDLYFLHLTMIYSLLKESPSILKDEEQEIAINQNKVARNGLNLKIKLNVNKNTVRLDNYSLNLLSEMLEMAKHLSLNKEYTKAVNEKILMIKENKGRSQRLILESQNRKLDIQKLILEKSLNSKKILKQDLIPKNVLLKLEKITKDSIQKTKIKDECTFPEYLSTLLNLN